MFEMWQILAESAVLKKARLHTDMLTDIPKQLELGLNNLQAEGWEMHSQIEIQEQRGFYLFRRVVSNDP